MQNRIGLRRVGFDVVAFYFLENFVRSAFVFVLDINDRVNEMLVFKGTKPVFPTNTREDRGVPEGCLAVEI